MTELSTDFGFQEIHGRVRHPQSQGQVERANGTLCSFMSRSLDEMGGGKRWIDIIGIFKIINFRRVCLQLQQVEAPCYKREAC